MFVNFTLTVLGLIFGARKNLHYFILFSKHTALRRELICWQFWLKKVIHFE